ncbi:hypothetical protein AMYX_42340 [Anaeromyxobacter diazotrophicus]|uniref:DUF2239 domain-containing protein n=2 Tax=Anaeromyxobacter diazotrophicus TaxID=2590199 RepID=A0A7I9VSR5_9BACT|nr:hypothetical protein AMYX_42340 [Anaeromyxobacter diazotrophicus]
MRLTPRVNRLPSRLASQRHRRGRFYPDTMDNRVVSGYNAAMDEPRSYTAFADDRLIASGPLEEMLAGTKAWVDRKERARLLIFDDATGREVDFDLRGSLERVLARAAPPAAEPGRPGRPRLGVVGREVSLLPRHWEWLEEQPNGISAALRRLVDEARKREPGKQRARSLREAASRFMTAMAGDRDGYEEASRALFAGDIPRFERLVRAWPADVRKYLLRWVREAAKVEGADGGAEG